jgi:hypothetical protein
MVLPPSYHAAKPIRLRQSLVPDRFPVALKCLVVWERWVDCEHVRIPSCCSTGRGLISHVHPRGRSAAGIALSEAEPRE